MIFNSVYSKIFFGNKGVNVDVKKHNVGLLLYTYGNRQPNQYLINTFLSRDGYNH